jgi:Aerotolerance regulator N-terminal/von Willebrand factor type A domain
MSFLTPAFLLGALAVAIPILVHLTNREKKEIVEFPSLMFLRKIPYRSVRRQRLRHLFLFALRCLALLLVALAFARPFFQAPPSAAASALGPREVVFLVDNSYSMGYENRMERAKDEVRSEVRSLGADERASIVLFSDRAEILDESTSDKAALEATVAGIGLSARKTRFGPALKLAKKIVDESRFARKEVVLISDFQRLGFQQEDDDAWLPSGTRLTPVDLSSPETENTAVTGVVLARDSLSGKERLEASARVTYKAKAGSAPRETRIQIELDGRTLQTKTLSLAPNDSNTVGFDPVTLPPGISRGTIRVDADALPADDAYHFVLSPGQAIQVLGLGLDRGGRGGARGSFYVEKALELGDRPAFRVSHKPLAQLSASDLTAADVVFLDDAASLSEAQGKLLDGFVQNGGGLLVALGEASSKKSFGGTGAKLLPAPLGNAVDRSRDWGGTLSYLDYGSPVFELFGAPHSGDFSSAKFFRYLAFETPVSDGVLARFDDGAPALVERRLGEGRVLVWTSTLDTFWNDLARQPVFLPFVHRLVEYAAGYAEASSWHQVGEVADLDRYLAMMRDRTSPVSGSGREHDHDLVITSPSSLKTVISATEERALLPLEEQGFYEIRQVGQAGSPGPVSLAVNLDSVESDLSRLDPEELVASVSFRETKVAGASAATGSTDSKEDQEGRQRSWWFLLVGAFILLATETLLSNRLSMSGL